MEAVPPSQTLIHKEHVDYIRKINLIISKIKYKNDISYDEIIDIKTYLQTEFDKTYGLIMDYIIKWKDNYEYSGYERIGQQYKIQTKQYEYAQKHITKIEYYRYKLYSEIKDKDIYLDIFNYLHELTDEEHDIY